MNNTQLPKNFKRTITIGNILTFAGIAAVVFLGVQEKLSLHDPFSLFSLAIATTGWLIITVAFIKKMAGGGFLKDFPQQKQNEIIQKQRKYAWIVTFAGTLFLLVMAITGWHSVDTGFGPWFLIFFGPLSFSILGKGSRPWDQTLEAETGLAARDERESTILHHATYYAFYFALFILVLLSFVFYYGAPSKDAQVMLFGSTMFFLLGIRNFIAWRMGLK